MNAVINPVPGVDQAFLYILGFSVVLLLGITIVMIVFVFKYSRSRNPLPSDIRDNWKLEVLWTVIPSIIALSMFYYGWSSYTGLRNVPAGALEIEVTGQMYSWIFLYPNDKETENELVVPLGKPVKLNITSSDVLHSLFIPAYRIKVDAVPGMKTYAWFLPDKPGSYYMQCAEFCGVGHADMTATLRVVPEPEYEEWLEIEEE
ncbi:MAG: cytochrome c oxidase subunit II [Desulfobacteraceae bacterium]|nr:MAG: cytochrome c oxidase subunit II [Desulfobacteraceae bacterium]